MHPNPCEHGDSRQSDEHAPFLEAAIAAALRAEAQGNLPVGAVLVLDQEIVAVGENALLVPQYQPGAHAEMQALRAVPVELWPRAGEMTCYTSLEPCLMCYGSLLLHGVGQIVFGADDPEGGFRWIENALPPYYQTQRSAPRWCGPLAQEQCQELYERARSRFVELPCG